MTFHGFFSFTRAQAYTHNVFLLRIKIGGFVSDEYLDGGKVEKTFIIIIIIYIYIYILKRCFR